MLVTLFLPMINSTPPYQMFHVKHLHNFYQLADRSHFYKLLESTLVHANQQSLEFKNRVCPWPFITANSMKAINV